VDSEGFLGGLLTGWNLLVSCFEASQMRFDILKEG